MADVSKHTFGWTIPNVTDGDLIETKTFAMQVLDLDVRCFAGFAKSFYQSYNQYMHNSGQNIPYQQGFSYQLIWADCERKPLLYACNVQVLNNGVVIWSDKKEDFVCSLAVFPKNTATLNASSGTVTINFAFEFRSKDRVEKKSLLSMLKDSVEKKSFMSMMKDKVLTDFTIVCGRERFDCHKVVLARHSEVFERMLTGSFKEANEGKTVITVFSPDVVKRMLYYIYSDTVAEETVTWELFEAAKMYELPGLQDLCLRSLRKNLNVDNCCKMLEATFKHDLDDMFELAMEFVKKNKAEVARADGWKAVTKNNELLAKILIHLM